MSIAATPKGERRRQALVEAAADLILEGGIDAVRHRSVATRAGLPLASTTYYFDSLDDLVSCAVHFNSVRELDEMGDWVREVPQSSRAVDSTADLIVDLLIGPRAIGPQTGNASSRDTSVMSQPHVTPSCATYSWRCVNSSTSCSPNFSTDAGGTCTRISCVGSSR